MIVLMLSDPKSIGNCELHSIYPYYACENHVFISLEMLYCLLKRQYFRNK